jgi:hypothetical protein
MKCRGGAQAKFAGHVLFRTAEQTSRLEGWECHMALRHKTKTAL